MLRRVDPTDLAIAALGVALTGWIVWVQPTFGNAVAGPRWFTYAWPFLLAGPLAWRRAAPLTVCLLVLLAVDLQSAITSNSAEGLEVLYAIGVAMYSVAAFGTRRRALMGLGGLAVGYGIFVWFDHNVQTGDSGQVWSAAFFAVAFLALWFAGVWVNSHRRALELTARTADLERDAAAALADERARMARELHDIVSHNLSVVVLQAAGARAGGASASTLEKIERSGREALVEMRRLLGVLREDDEAPELFAPQPGIAQLEQLADTLRAAGVPVDISVAPDTRKLTPALELAVYRIVQESLTNVLKHAGPARAMVEVSRDGASVVVRVIDNGGGANGTAAGGHGLAGMRERVALFGGELRAGTAPRGGFEVLARLPVGAT